MADITEMPLSIRDNYLEYPYYPHDDPSSHDTSQSTDEDFDFDDYVNLEPEQQPINMDPNSPGIDVSRSATLERLERGTQASRQENTPQSTLSQPHSPVTQSPSNNGVLDDMQIDNEQKDEQGGNENGGSGDVFEALSSIERSFCDPESTRNKNTLPLIGIPKSDVTTYPLNGHAPRPNKRSRTGNEEEQNGGLQDYIQTVLEGFSKYISVDPSPSEKGMFAQLFRMSSEDVDKFFWEQRSSMNKPPTIVVQDDTLNSPESSRARSNIQEAEIFSQNGQPSPSESNFSMTNTSVGTHPNFCTHPACSRSFKSPSDWKVHEELVHWVQKRYLCLLCAIRPAADKTRYFCKACSAPFFTLGSCITHVMQCQSARRLQTTPYKRYFDFNVHLRSHPVGDREVKVLFESVRNNKDWYYPVESDWPRTCSYYNCSQEFKSWEERQEHYPAFHFKNKKSVSSRRSATGVSRLSLSSTPSSHPRLSQEPQDTG